MEQVPSFSNSDTSVDESKIHGIPELPTRREPSRNEAPQTVAAREISADKKDEVNPILLVFKAMIVAKGILRKGVKETKSDNRRHERQWEAVVIQVQEQHKNTVASQKKWSYAYAVLPVMQLSGMIGSQWIKEKDPVWVAATNQSLSGFSDRRHPWLQGTSRMFTDRMVTFFNDDKRFEYVDKMTSTAHTMTFEGIKGQMENLNVLNQAEQAPLQMKSQSASSLYQNRESDESAEKQQLSEVDRSMRDLMQQESQVFQGSTNRG